MLPVAKRTGIYGGWASYRKYDCPHKPVQCTSLAGGDIDQRTVWSSLVEVQDRPALAAHWEVAQDSGYRMTQINADYTAILTQGDRIHPTRKRKDGTPYRSQSTPTNLSRHKREHREYVLSFLSDPVVLFTNNIAEQAVRMSKVKQKISGCFRTFDGASSFCTNWFSISGRNPAARLGITAPWRTVTCYIQQPPILLYSKEVSLSKRLNVLFKRYEWVQKCL